MYVKKREYKISDIDVIDNSVVMIFLLLIVIYIISSIIFRLVLYIFNGSLYFRFEIFKKYY